MQSKLHKEILLRWKHNSGKKLICTIAAYSKKGRVIGLNGKIPWNIPEDLSRFKFLTTGNAIIMGRKTFESIGRLLPNRMNIVLSRKKNLSILKNMAIEGDLYFASSVEQAIMIAEKAGYDKIFFCGGEQVYKQSIKLSDILYLTEIDGEYKGDSFFPEFDKNKFALIEKTQFDKGTFFTWQAKTDKN